MDRAAFERWLRLGQRPTLVMGVLNITPDSFSDGGQFTGADDAVRRGIEMIEQGADLLDVGGESTRPGSLAVDESEQITRVVPVINGITQRIAEAEQLAGDKSAGVVISIDTTRAAVADAALAAGAAMVNDISAGRDDAGMLPLVAKRGCPIVLMHMLGTPRTMQQNPLYKDVVAEVRSFLVDRVDAAVAAGVAPEQVLIDPGIGFGKTLVHNLQLLRHLDLIGAAGRPMVIGVSRKAFIGTLTDEPVASKRLFGTAAAVAWSVANGAQVLRVHDVKEMNQVVRVIQAIQRI